MINIRFTRISELEGTDFFFVDQLPKEIVLDFQKDYTCIADMGGNKIYSLRSFTEYARKNHLDFHQEYIECPEINYKLNYRTPIEDDFDDS